MLIWKNAARKRMLGKMLVLALLGGLLLPSGVDASEPESIIGYWLFDDWQLKQHIKHN